MNRYKLTKIAMSVLSLSLITSLCFPALSEQAEAKPIATSKGGYIQKDFNIRPISGKQDYYYLEKPVPMTPKTSLDEHGVPVYRKGGKDYNHPVRLAHNSINMITSYQMTHKAGYLENAKKYTQRLRDIAVMKQGAMYFPYEFDVYLHNIPTEHMKPKWYSAMAQGQALSAFVRLYKVTHDPKYLQWAHQTFRSLTQLKTPTHKQEPWVARVDATGHLWFELYPMEAPTKVLNGFIFAILGIYDYYQLTNNAQAKSLIQGGLTTVKNHVALYRLPGNYSRYCLKHPHQSPHYHMVHVVQLEELYHITGDEYFLKMKNAFQKDANFQQDLQKIRRGMILQ